MSLGGQLQSIECFSLHGGIWGISALFCQSMGQSIKLLGNVAWVSFKVLPINSRSLGITHSYVAYSSPGTHSHLTPESCEAQGRMYDTEIFVHNSSMLSSMWLVEDVLLCLQKVRGPSRSVSLWPLLQGPPMVQTCCHWPERSQEALGAEGWGPGARVELRLDA